MYKIRNISLDYIKEKYKADKLEDLSQKELIEVCREKKVSVVERMKRKINPATGRNYDTPLFSKFDTIDAIIAKLSPSEYVSKDFWAEAGDRIAQLNEEEGILEKARKHLSGNETFQLFARFGLGFYKLEPFGEVELDVPESWVEWLKESPIGKILQISRIDVKQENITLDKKENGTVNRLKK